MSIRRSLAQRTAVLTVTAAAVLTRGRPVCPRPPIRPRSNVDSCEQTLLRAALAGHGDSDGARLVPTPTTTTCRGSRRLHPRDLTTPGAALARRRQRRVRAGRCRWARGPAGQVAVPLRPS